MAKGTLKGYAFEYFVRRLLLACGFSPIISDGLLVFDGSAGQMIQGLGQCHNADVLVSPPFQTPFYYQTRLLVECKCYSEPLGLSFARNVLGLREDINNFDIVTKEILENRKSGHTTKPHSFPIERYLYQVALASITGFRKTTISYSGAHKIPLISFAESLVFKRVRDIIDTIDKISDPKEIEKLKKIFRNPYYRPYDDREIKDINSILSAFIDEINEITRNIRIGLLENGMILFLVKDAFNTVHMNKNNTYSDGYTLHWADDSKSWFLQNQDEVFFFELPHELIIAWKKDIKNWEEDFTKKQRALQIKQEFMSKIILFGNKDVNALPTIIKLSQLFIDEAYEDLEKSEE